MAKTRAKTPQTVTLSADEFKDLMEKAKPVGRGLLVHAKFLRQCAAEISRAGHNGWGNTCLQAAEAIERAVGKFEEQS